MPAQRLAERNPPADPSHLPDSVLGFRAYASAEFVITPAELSSLRKFTRAANYIAAGSYPNSNVCPSLCSARP